MPHPSIAAASEMLSRTEGLEHAASGRFHGNRAWRSRFAAASELLSISVA